MHSPTRYQICHAGEGVRAQGGVMMGISACKHINQYTAMKRGEEKSEERKIG